jgi:hypothetical protein
MMRRLRLPDDETLIREAYRWDEDRPRWWRDMDRVFNSGTENDFVAKARDPLTAFIGIFEINEDADTPTMLALVIVETPAPFVHEGHLCVKRKADTLKVTTACAQLIGDLFSLGMTQAFVWVAERNIAVRKLCVTLGLQPDGVAQWRAAFRRKNGNHPIKWLRHSINRQQIEVGKAA